MGSFFLGHPVDNVKVSGCCLQSSIFQGNILRLVLVKSVGQEIAMGLSSSASAPLASCVVPGVLMVKSGMALLLGIANLTQNIQRGKSVTTTSR